MSKKWSKAELKALSTIGSHLRRNTSANILSKVFKTNRSSKTVGEKCWELNVFSDRTDDHFQEAIKAVNESNLSSAEKTKILSSLSDYENNSIPKSSSNSNKPKQVFTQDADQNYAVAEQSSNTNPKSVDELIELFDIDMSVWEVEKYTVNRWEQAQRSSSGVKVVPLFQIKVWLVRKEPIAYKWPVVQPIDGGKFTYKKAASSKKRQLKKAIVIPDSQITYRRDPLTGYLEPTHDRAAWDVICQIAEEEKPDDIILLGDMLDLPDWTDKFLVTPDLAYTTQPALLEFHWWLKRMANLTPHIVYLEGNHEVRLQNAIARNLIAACDLRPANQPQGPSLLSIPTLLGLDGLGVEYVGPYPYGEYWINNNLRAVHGEVVRQGSGATVAAFMKDLQSSVIFGHIHRLELASKIVWVRNGPVQYIAASPGTIARIDPGIVPSNKARQNWQNGFAVVDYEPGDGSFNIDLVSVIQGNCIYKGKIWSGHNVSKTIATDTSWPSLFK